MSEQDPEVAEAPATPDPEAQEEAPAPTGDDAVEAADLPATAEEGADAEVAKPPKSRWTDLVQGFYVVSVLPLLLYAGAELYGRQFGGTAAGYAGLVVMVPILASYLLGGGGVILIFVAKRRGAPLLGPIVATCVAASLVIWFLLQVILKVFARSLLIDLGLY
jgi:hypothetical protein